MKKTLIAFLLIILISINLPVFSVNNSQVAEIAKIENSLYGFDYSKNTLEERLQRLEKSIYGKTFNGDIKKRIEKMAVDIASSQIGNEITPTEDTFREDENIADSSVDYPILNEIEMKIFNQTYKNRDFHTRIVTIERKLFGKIYDIDDYSKRMDRIKSEVMPEKLAEEKVYGNDDELTYNGNDGYNYYSQTTIPNNMYGQQNYTRPYANYGDFQSPDSYIQEPSSDINDELAQLEQQIFGTEFSNDDTKTRIKRLNSVNRAKKTSRKYDSNKFHQHMSTAMEIGAMILMILAMVL